MKDTEIDQAIADACNWSYVGINTRTMFCTGENYVGRPTVDLNAMHEAEKVIQKDADHVFDYMEYLERITNFAPHFATAAQRAEAFLRTLDLWKP